MKYFMLDKNDISEVRGIVNSKDVMKALGIGNKEFTKMIRQNKPYKGCILIPCREDDDKRLVTSEDEEWYQLIGVSPQGFKYYATSHLRIISKSPKSGKEKELTSYNGYLHMCIGGKRYNTTVLRECYRAFIGEVKKNEIVICEGERKIENLKKVSKTHFASQRNKKKVLIGDTIYESVAECAKKNFISPIYCYQMLEGAVPNKYGIKYA